MVYILGFVGIVIVLLGGVVWMLRKADKAMQDMERFSQLRTSIDDAQVDLPRPRKLVRVK